MARILIAEDEASMRRILSALLAEDSHEVKSVSGANDARQILAKQSFDLVLTDQQMPNGDGLSLLAYCRENEPSIPVIMITAHATVDLAVRSMRDGAFDFITKPFDPEVLLAAVRRALAHGKLMRENARLRDEVSRLEYGQTELLGNSAVIRSVREMIGRVAPTDATVLITGETGTGKEVVARLIHQNSRRAASPFVAVNCAALPETLLESQLFGHERGAFTGADRARVGLFESANGGTLFLDEAGDMPLSLQAKLLRVLMDGEIMRVGAVTARHVDVRIIAATHRELRARITEGLFREDLYYRLAVVPVPIAPLRQRREDVATLAAFFCEIVATDLKVPRRTLSPDAITRLSAYDFPGNVRELRNLIERAYILGRDQEIAATDIPLGDGTFTPPAAPDTLEACLSILDTPLDLKETLERIEVMLVEQALNASGGNQAEASRNLGISRSDMNYKLKKYNLRENLSL